jgi:hypothetical protein
MTDYIKIKLWAATWRVGSKEERTVKVPREDWEQLTEREKEEYMLDELWNNSLIEWGWAEQD